MGNEKLIKTIAKLKSLSQKAVEAGNDLTPERIKDIKDQISKRKTESYRGVYRNDIGEYKSFNILKKTEAEVVEKITNKQPWGAYNTNCHAEAVELAQKYGLIDMR